MAAIAIPAYQDYIAKSQATSGLAEISPAKTQFEMAVNEGKTPSLIASQEGFVGVTASSSQYCDVTLVGTSPNITGIACSLKNGNASKINSKTITLTRDSATGTWSCATGGGLESKYKPGSCA